MGRKTFPEGPVLPTDLPEANSMAAGRKVESRLPVFKAQHYNRSGVSDPDNYSQLTKDRQIERLQIAKILVNKRMVDRIGALEGEEFETLASDIKRNGLQSPILVRRDGEGLLHLIAGRRRLEAVKRLNQDVSITDGSLRDGKIDAIVVAFKEGEDVDVAVLELQITENTSRLDFSYIERCLLVSRMDEAKKDNDFIERVMKIERSALSRMRSLTRQVPRSVIEAIGPARYSGRRPWEELQKLVRDPKKDEPVLLELIAKRADQPAPEDEPKEGENEKFSASDRRLRHLIDDFRGAIRRKRPTTTPSAKSYAGGKLLVDRKGAALTVRATSKDVKDFLDNLEARFDELYTEWVNEKNA